MQELHLVEVGLAALAGLVIGSFLNVVIHRLPKLLERQWAADCADHAGTEAPQQEALSLWRPKSRCPACGNPIRWYQNVPLLSFALLKGKCSACSASISLRYPLVELLSAAVFALCVERWGVSPVALIWITFACFLICQFWIDFDTGYLPDDLNYPLLWLGLLSAAMDWTIALSSAVWGAALGYLILWSFFHLYRLLTGKEGMGHGDFKLMSALGAWFGVEYLLAIILMSTAVGSLLGVVMLAIGKIAHKDIPIKFGPFLAGAGLLCMAIGPDVLRRAVPFFFPLSP